MVFFSPALFHAAGTNRSQDIKRMANLLQITHAFGRPMETLDRVRMCEALYPVLRSGRLHGRQLRNAVAAAAEGYAFPTNLDRDPPVGGLAPDSDQVFMLKALADGMDEGAFTTELRARREKRQSH